MPIIRIMSTVLTIQNLLSLTSSKFAKVLLYKFYFTTASTPFGACFHNWFGAPVSITLKIILEKICKLVGSSFEFISGLTILHPSFLRAENLLWHVFDRTLWHLQAKNWHHIPFWIRQRSQGAIMNCVNELTCVFQAATAADAVWSSNPTRVHQVQGRGHQSKQKKLPPVQLHPPLCRQLSQCSQK